MATYIKPSFTLAANKNSMSNAADKGPLSIGFNLATSDKLSVDDVRSKIVTVGTNSYTLIDGSAFGNNTTTEGAGGTYGCFLYIKNISTVTAGRYIYIGLDHDGGDGGTAADAGELQADDQAEDGTATAAIRFCTLAPGEMLWTPFDYTMDIIVDASHADQTLEYWVFDRGA